nr:hypothetical protein [Anoxybacillus flavithermus]
MFKYEGEIVEKIDEKIKKYNQIKIDLLKIVKCIDCCTEDEKELYQNIAIEYSKELKRLKKSIESAYDVKICDYCFYLDEKE